MDLRIGIIQAPRELDVELPDNESQESVHALIQTSLADTDGVLWVTDKRGRQIAVPVGRIAYVEIGADDTRRVGFGAS